MFENRWSKRAKKKDGWATRDDDEFDNGASLVLLDDTYLVHVWRTNNGLSLTMQNEWELNPSTLDKAKEMAEKFIEMLNKVEV
jgi:hypothetical protein